MHVCYLHGFASSARSSKARFYADRLARVGVLLHGPDFNEPDFSTLTVTRMLDRVDETLAALPEGPVALIGSSLGALVAWLATARRARGGGGRAGNGMGARGRGAGTAEEAEESGGVRASGTTADPHPIVKLILLAPAFDFGANRVRQLGPEGLARWKATDSLEFFHYGYGESLSVRYALYDDARRYDARAVRVDVPALVFQGSRDESVDPDMVRQFVAERPTMTLRELDDDHQLLASLDVIWRESAAFLGLEAATATAEPRAART